MSPVSEVGKQTKLFLYNAASVMIYLLFCPGAVIFENDNDGILKIASDLVVSTVFVQKNFLALIFI